MTPPDATPKSLFPAAATHALPALPRSGGSFGPPSTVDFPMYTDPEDDAMTDFGSRVQSDMDLDQLDGRVSHVRDAQFEPASYPQASYPQASYPPDVSPVAYATGPVTGGGEHAWRTTVVVFLAVFAVSALAGFAGVFFLTR